MCLLSTAPCRKDWVYGVTNDDAENVSQQSKHALVLKTFILNFRLWGVCQGLSGRLDSYDTYIHIHDTYGILQVSLESSQLGTPWQNPLWREFGIKLFVFLNQDMHVLLLYVLYVNNIYIYCSKRSGSSRYIWITSQSIARVTEYLVGVLSPQPHRVISALCKSERLMDSENKT